jgi:acyl-CoA thioesterase
MKEHAMHHPYADLIGLHVEELRAGFSKCTVEVTDKHLNPHHVVHGAVMYALADTGMGAALYPTLEPMQLCATLQLTMNYFKPVVSGVITCTTEVVNRGRNVAYLESLISVEGTLVATASGNYSIFTPSKHTA